MHAPAEHHKHHKLTGAECGSDVSGATGRRFAVKQDNVIGSERALDCEVEPYAVVWLRSERDDVTRARGVGERLG
jgi:hypothetical protein